MLYLPAEQARGDFLIRSSADEHSLRGVILEVVTEVDGSAQVEQIRPLQSIVNDMANRERMTAALSTAFASLAMPLASVGLYGVMAYSVARRTAELGIGIALGGQRADVQRLVLWETAPLVFAGIILGLAAALAVSRLIANMLYGVQANSFSIFAGSVLLLAAVAAIAAFLPAWRASRIDPMVALRYE
jgi:ABC-type antimicrobial peptide transport system permease subunit